MWFFFRMRSTPPTSQHECCVSQAHLHHIHCQAQTLPCCPVSVMLTVETCAALFTDKRQTKTTQRAKAAGWATAKAAPATQINEHLTQSDKSWTQRTTSLISKTRLLVQSHRKWQQNTPIHISLYHALKAFRMRQVGECPLWFPYV